MGMGMGMGSGRERPRPPQADRTTAGGVRTGTAVGRWVLLTTVLGINNAAARAAGLLAVAALPLLTGMGPDAYRDPREFDAAFHSALPVCAGLLVAGALIAWTAVRTPARPEESRPECRMHCPVAAPPLETGRDAS